MREIGFYFIIVILVVVILPFIIIKSFVSVKDDKLEDKKGQSIKLYISKSKQIKEIGFEDYIRGVVAAEMPASYDIEALKAQAVAARTYAWNKILNRNKKEHPDADLCSNPAHCQAWISKEDALKKWTFSKKYVYWEKITLAVKSTAGEMVYYKEELANPLFHANSGGHTEDAENVWGGSPVPYLKGVPSPGEEKASQFKSEKEFNFKEFINILKKESGDFQINQNKLDKEIVIKGRTAGGRVKELQIGNKRFRGTEIRKFFDLKSANFLFSVKDQKVIFKVKGYGHGAGMSQCGANAMAVKGKTYKEILEYYYTGVTVK